MTPVSIYFPEFRADAPPSPLANIFGVAGSAAEKGPDARRLKELAEAVAAGTLRAVPSLEQADVCVYPVDYRDNQFTRRAMAACKRRELPLIFFLSSDDSTPVHVEYGVVYRESLQASRKTPSERAMPAMCDDLLRDVPGDVVRPKQATPSVGFCGFVGSPVKRLYYTVTGRRRKVRGLNLRHRALRHLSADRGVSRQFISRTSFFGGAFSRFHRNVDRAAEVRREYLQNVLGTDYTLCLRGAGNFSFRFYEVLSAGRIPLFINTDCVLPFADRIDWRRHCVWVEEDQMGRAGEILRGFHDGISPEQFEETQRANRTLWRDWLSPRGFYLQILRDAVRENRGAVAS